MSKISNSLNNFRQLKEDINTLNVKSMSENEAQEFARNKEALIYIENYINLLDENLLPNAFFGEFQNCFVNWNRSMGHLTAIIDNALTILARYSTIYIPKNQAKPIVMEMIAGYNDAIKASLDDLKLEAIKNKITDVENYIQKFNIANGDFLKQKDEIYGYFNEIEKIRTNLVVRQEDKDISIQQEIENARNKIAQDLELTKEKITENYQKLEEIGKFHIKIFGELNDNVRSGGLEQKLDNMFKDLDEYKGIMKTRFDEYDKIIKELNEKATNASLSASYGRERNSISETIVFWNFSFIVCILFIFLVALWSFYDLKEILNFDVKTTIAQLGQSNDAIATPYISALLNNRIYIIFFGFFSKITMALPLIWLAIFCSNRRKEAMRLSQEYAHKVAIASSYESYKEQIKNLNEENQELLTKLMSSTIDIISKNPSDFLDKSKSSDRLIDYDEIVTKIKQLPEWLIDVIKQKSKN
ncbi:hypothetical protein [Campylobacter concisus]|uniref:hypothetical protein n=1 Tax=Campylobacter concisus TaxID=199 RepID=UPI000D2FFD29|nr:hypothetical protein [Campylobacter concisus]